MYQHENREQLSCFLLPAVAEQDGALAAGAVYAEKNRHNPVPADILVNTGHKY